MQTPNNLTLVEDNRKISWMLYQILYKTSLKYWCTTFPYASSSRQSMYSWIWISILCIMFYPSAQTKRQRFVNMPKIKFGLGVRSREVFQLYFKKFIRQAVINHYSVRQEERQCNTKPDQYCWKQWIQWFLTQDFFWFSCRWVKSISDSIKYACILIEIIKQVDIQASTLQMVLRTHLCTMFVSSLRDQEDFVSKYLTVVRNVEGFFPHMCNHHLRSGFKNIYVVFSHKLALKYI